MLLLGSAPVVQLTQSSNCLASLPDWSHVVNIDSMFLCFDDVSPPAHLRRYICYSILAWPGLACCMSPQHLPHTLCLALTITWVFLQITWPIVSTPLHSTALHSSQPELRESKIDSAVRTKYFPIKDIGESEAIWSLYYNDIADTKCKKNICIWSH